MREQTVSALPLLPAEKRPWKIVRRYKDTNPVPPLWMRALREKVTKR